MDATAKSTSKSKPAQASEKIPLPTLISRLRKAAEGEGPVTIGAVFEAMGTQSYGPMLLLPALISISPMSGIPTLPSILAVVILLTAGQIVAGRSHFWLPAWILRRTIPRKAYVKGLDVLKKPAKKVDEYFHPRMRFLTGKLGAKVIAGICILIALTMPPLEPLPFLATSSGLVIAVFALALTSQDGLFALIGFLLIPAMGGVVYWLAIH